MTTPRGMLLQFALGYIALGVCFAVAVLYLLIDAVRASWRARRRT